MSRQLQFEAQLPGQIHALDLAVNILGPEARPDPRTSEEIVEDVNRAANELAGREIAVGVDAGVDGGVAVALVRGDDGVVTVIDEAHWTEPDV